jgi:hypothetical protein
MRTGELYVAQEDGSRPTILVHGHVPGEGGVSVVSLRFQGGLHFGATTQQHLVTKVHGRFST